VLALVGREPQHLAALGFEPAIASLVVVNLFLKAVAGAVQLDDETGGRTVEVDYVLPDGVLTTELEALELAAAEAGPDAALLEGRVGAEGSRTLGPEFGMHLRTIPELRVRG
jgi:hypothetical protein